MAAHSAAVRGNQGEFVGSALGSLEAVSADASMSLQVLGLPPAGHFNHFRGINAQDTSRARRHRADRLMRRKVTSVCSRSVAPLIPNCVEHGSTNEDIESTGSSQG